MRLPRVGVDATPGTCSTVGCVVKLFVAVAVDHDGTAANGSGAIGRDAGGEAVDVSPDVAPAAGPRPAAAKSGKGGMVGKKRTLDTPPCCGLLLERGSLTETGPAPRWATSGCL